MRPSTVVGRPSRPRRQTLTASWYCPELTSAWPRVTKSLCDTWRQAYLDRRRAGELPRQGACESLISGSAPRVHRSERSGPGSDRPRVIDPSGPALGRTAPVSSIRAVRPWVGALGEPWHLRAAQANLVDHPPG